MAKKLVRIGRSKTGLGLFAKTEIRKRAIIVYYTGRRISTEYANSAETRDARYMFEINSRWTIDGKSRRNLGRYAQSFLPSECGIRHRARQDLPAGHQEYSAW